MEHRYTDAHAPGAQRMDPDFRIDNATGELVVLESPTGAERWRGLPGGRKARLMAVAGERCIVVGEPDIATKNDRNLYCFDGAGHQVWRGTAPDMSGPDHYVAARVEGDHVIAHSWSGYRVVLDLASGELREVHCVK